MQANGGAGLMATVPVEVEQADIALEGVSGVLGPDEAETLHARVPSQGNREIATGLQWSSTDTAVAGVGPNGIVHARQPGRAEIVMNGFGQERRAALTVHRLPEVLVVTPWPPADALMIPLRATREFSAVAEAADSTPIPEARITWAVGDSTKVAFDRATGALTARDTGATTLTVRLHGFEAVVWTAARHRRRHRTRAGPGRARGRRADDRRGQLLDEAGKVIAPATGVEWSSDRPDVAAVAGGEVRAISPGRAVVSAGALGRQARHRGRLRHRGSARRVEPHRRVRALSGPGREPRLAPAGPGGQRLHTGRAVPRPDADRVQLEPEWELRPLRDGRRRPQRPPHHHRRRQRGRAGLDPGRHRASSTPPRPGPACRRS